MSKISILLSRVSLWVSGLGLLLMTAIISWQVFARYVLSAPPAWTEQLALLLMLWFILFAAASGVREGFHIRLSLIVELSKPLTAKVLRLFAHSIVLLVAVMMAKEGIALAHATSTHMIPTLGISRAFAYYPFVLSGIATVFFAGEHIVCELTNKKVAPAWN